jgi:hypothetical protein
VWYVVTLLRASTWSSFPIGSVPVSQVASRDFLVLYCLSLIYCKRVSSSLCIGSAVCGFIYKAGRKPVSRRWVHVVLSSDYACGLVICRHNILCHSISSDLFRILNIGLIFFWLRYLD